MCGKVQCTNVDLTSIPPGAHVSIQIVEGFTCINADFNLGTDVLDPAYVNPGSPCDKGKVKIYIYIYIHKLCREELQLKQEIKLRLLFQEIRRQTLIASVTHTSSPLSDLYRLPVRERLCSTAQFGL